jgi:hypothetical protein
MFVAFYNKRGTCEQWIKEGKGSDPLDAALVPLFRRQRRSPSALCARYNLCNFLRTLATP